MQQQSVLLVEVVLLSTACLAFACEEDDAQGDQYDSDVLTRPDHTPCSDVLLPEANEFIIHFTRNSIKNGMFTCDVYRRSINLILRYSNLQFITSPGFHYIDKYPNNRLVFYNLSCGDGHHMALQFNKFDLQGKVRPMSGPKVCVDYVNISSPSLGADMIFCGVHNNLSIIHISESSAFITFRSSGKMQCQGFNMTVTCLPTEKSLATTDNCTCDSEEEKEPEMVKHLSFITGRLLYLHCKFTQTDHLLSEAEYEEMLKLGVESEDVCNPIVKAVGAVVLKSFPDELVTQYKTTSSMQD